MLAEQWPQLFAHAAARPRGRRALGSLPALAAAAAAILAITYALAFSPAAGGAPL
jgi:hypothetical protein